MSELLLVPASSTPLPKTRSEVPSRSLRSELGSFFCAGLESKDIQTGIDITKTNTAQIAAPMMTLLPLFATVLLLELMFGCAVRDIPVWTGEVEEPV